MHQYNENPVTTDIYENTRQSNVYPRVKVIETES